MVDTLTLMRVEHKLDMVIRAMQSGVMLPSPLPSLQDTGTDTCPVCEHPYKWDLDLESESVCRSCGCRPKISAVKGISTLLTPEKEAAHGRTSSDPGDSASSGPSDGAESRAPSSSGRGDVSGGRH